MNRQAFTPDEYSRAKKLLAAKVATMMGRKFEEGDWASVYCGAKNIPNRKWSNVDIDVINGNIGIEHKMLCKPSSKIIHHWCGEEMMHPSATRKIRIPQGDDATAVAREILEQYNGVIEETKTKIRNESSCKNPELRNGWLLWQESLEEFLYFEQVINTLNVNQFTAEWHESGGGSRKKSRNLWVYKGNTKQYSITTEAGAKIQPYFRVPLKQDSNLYYFRVQGEIADENNVRIWVTNSTMMALRAKFNGDISSSILNTALSSALTKNINSEILSRTDEIVFEMLIDKNLYRSCKDRFKPKSDDHLIQLLLFV